MRFEYEQYRAANKLLPRVGERVMTPDGPAKVIVGHPLKETVSVIPERKSPDEWVHTAERTSSEYRATPKNDATSASCHRERAVSDLFPR